MPPRIRPPLLPRAGKGSTVNPQTCTGEGSACMDERTQGRRALLRLRPGVSCLGHALGSSSWLPETRMHQRDGRKPVAYNYDRGAEEMRACMRKLSCAPHD